MNNDRCCYCKSVLVDGQSSGECPTCEGTEGVRSGSPDMDAVLRNLDYRVNEARHEGAGYSQVFTFTRAQLDGLASALRRPCLSRSEVLAAERALAWALAKVPMTGWKPEYERRFVEEYNEAVRSLDVLKEASK